MPVHIFVHDPDAKQHGDIIIGSDITTVVIGI